MNMKITVGCDPEFFVAQEGKFRSAHGLIPGTKENPFRVNKGAVQVDGMALEFNTDPVDNADDFVSNINTVMGELRGMVPLGLDFVITPSCRFNGNHFRAQPDEAKELGCTPDFNAYTMKANPRPDNKTTMRTASGHIHVGFLPELLDNEDTDEHHTRCATLVKQLDCYLGLSSILWDKDTKRRKMYGGAGAYRPKKYGVEYRVLSNAWLLSEDRIRFVFNQTVKAVNDLVNGVRVADNVGDVALIQAINHSDSFWSQRFISDYMPDGREVLKQAQELAYIKQELLR